MELQHISECNKISEGYISGNSSTLDAVQAARDTSSCRVILAIPYIRGDYLARSLLQVLAHHGLSQARECVGQVNAPQVKYPST